MICLVVGPSASGKSAWAEARAEELARQGGPELTYLATMRDEGPEAHARVERHRAQRAGKGFSTLCTPTLDGLARVKAGRGQVALLDDVGNLVANEMFAPGREAGARPTPEELAREVAGALRGLGRRCAHLVVVADEVGAAGWHEVGPTLDWIVCCGTCCCMLADAADEVVEVRAGVAARLRGEAQPRRTDTPERDGVVSGALEEQGRVWKERRADCRACRGRAHGTGGETSDA